MKVKFRLNTNIVRRIMKEEKLSYQDIADMSGNSISVNQLKYFMNMGNQADEQTIELLANILGCDSKLLVDDKDLISLNIPSEVNFILKNLYVRLEKEVQPIYREGIKEFQKNNDLQRMIEIAHKLFRVFSSEDIYFNKDLILNATNLLIDEFSKVNFIANGELTELTYKEADALYAQLQEWDGVYHPHLLFLIFTYAFIIFDAVFLIESISTSAELMPIRKNRKADQYFVLTADSERMRDKLVNTIVYDGFAFEGRKDDMPIEDTGIDDEIITGIILLLSTCERCYQHLQNEWYQSEYVNRATLGAVLRRLEKIFNQIELVLPEKTYCEMLSSRFGRKYIMLQGCFETMKSPQRHKSITNTDLMMAYMIGCKNN